MEQGLVKGILFKEKTDIGNNYDAIRGIVEKDLLSRRNDKVRGNNINSISATKQKTRIGKKRLSDTEKILNSNKISKLSTLEELKFRGDCE